MRRRADPATSRRTAVPWPVDAAELDELQRLRLVGVASPRPPRAGERPSHRFGLGYDFSDFRRYQPGDRLQHVDWTRYCLSGGREVYVRKYYEELSAENAVLLDASASMGALADDDKLATALHVAFLLLYAATGRYETAGLAVLGGRGAASMESAGWNLWPALTREAAVEDLEAELSGVEAAGSGTLDLLRTGEPTLSAHLGSIVLLSDLFVPADRLVRILDALRVKTSRLHVVQFVGALDLEPFERAQDVEWLDAETGECFQAHYDPKSHLQHVEELLEAARVTSEDLGASYLRVDCPVRGTATDLLSLLVDGEVLEEA